MTQTEKFDMARKRAEAKYGFFVHASVYGAVMVLLVVINVFTSPENTWFIWPLVGWGFAVALHGVRVYFLADRKTVIDALTENELRRSGIEKRSDGK
ncbi:2TM domain-containing protein [Limimaricola hongkongensis]|uniref:2TM domain-containing protein n=1 Tax=Limimaricola hongkongensis TaxID=278132 RepID=UPI00037EF710|nr:2TM domain-containing protein [Limimaricola hongkongensis]